MRRSFRSWAVAALCQSIARNPHSPRLPRPHPTGIIANFNFQRLCLKSKTLRRKYARDSSALAVPLCLAFQKSLQSALLTNSLLRPECKQAEELLSASLASTFRSCLQSCCKPMMRLEANSDLLYRETNTCIFPSAAYNRLPPTWKVHFMFCGK